MSKIEHYYKLKSQYDAGTMHEVFIPAYKELDAEYSVIIDLMTFQPIHILRPVWNAFWDIRGTKSFENPVTFIDIQAYNSLMQTTFHPNEVKLLIGWDKLYYKYYRKYIL